MNNILHTENLEPKNGFTFKLNFLVEDIPYEDSSDETQKDLKEIYRKLDNYEYVYFCAQVIAYKHGIKLGTSYLGCCLYESYDDFLKDSQTLTDLIDEAMKEAIENIKLLTSDAVQP